MGKTLYKKGDIVVVAKSKTKARILGTDYNVDYMYTIYHLETLDDGFKFYVGEFYIDSLYYPYMSEEAKKCDCGAKHTQDIEHQHYTWCSSLKMEAELYEANKKFLENCNLPFASLPTDICTDDPAWDSFQAEDAVKKMWKPN